MNEGSLKAPMRHPLAWQDPDFYDPAKLEAEMRRVFDICHTCRRCFNLCDSFPRLFDLIDGSPSGELHDVATEALASVVEACTLCDMCFMTKCPYVPPHEFNLDFPHLMLRARAIEARQGRVSFADRALAATDRNGKLAGAVAPLANWAGDTANTLTRPVLEATAGVDRRAELPKFHSKTFARAARATPVEVNQDAPAYGRKAVLYATCFVNYNDPEVGLATRAVLAKNGVETGIVYPRCCGMPLLEQGRIDKVADSAKEVAATLVPWIEKGYDVVALLPSCALMLKFEWPLILPDDANVKRLSAATRDVSEYVVEIAKTKGLAPGMHALPGGIAVHLACHARAQNMGPKAADMLRLIPEAEVEAIERCSGHGGSWGFMKANFDVALKIGRPVARQAKNGAKAYIASECPLAGVHIAQGMERVDGEGTPPRLVTHPIQLLALAYGIGA
jgi:glycerol-3-phosphate dehydrogenase subunit C